jgi:hypothetical protein
VIRISCDEKRPVCAICGKEISVEVAFIFVQGTIMIDAKTPPQPTMFHSWEQASNYAQGYYAHSTCWMRELKNKGIELYDITKLRQERMKKRKNKDAQKS